MTYRPFPTTGPFTLRWAMLTLGLALTQPVAASEIFSETAEKDAVQQTLGGESSEEKAEEDQAMLDQGRIVFLEEATPACNICHVLEEAEAKGRVGPNLDEMKPDAEMVRAALMSGPGAMPEYGARLDEAQIEAVSRYVAKVSGGAEDEPDAPPAD